LQKAEEDRKKKEKILHLAREQAKQNFDKVNNQPGLKDLQDKSESSQKGDDGAEDEEGTKKKKKKKN